MQYRIKRTVPWADGYLRPGEPVPEGVPEVVLRSWLRDGKAEEAKGDGGRKRG